MKIGIIGAGHIGGTLAGLLTRAGHEVILANSRGSETLREQVEELGQRATAATATEAAEQGEIVIEAVPFGKLSELPHEQLKGKVLLTASNHYPSRDGAIDLKGLTQSEYLQRLLPETPLAKVFNTIYWEHLRDQGDTSKPLEERRVLPFVASNKQAEDVARTLIEELGFGPLFLGDLPMARGLSETDDRLYNKQLSLAEARAMMQTKQG
jgi:predicted dinucleotide-binding enzyme